MLASFRKGQTVMVLSASYLSTRPKAPREATVSRVVKGEVHLSGWEFPFSTTTGRQIIPAGYEKPLTSTAWIEV